MQQKDCFDEEMSHEKPENNNPLILPVNKLITEVKAENSKSPPQQQNENEPEVN